MIDLDDIPGCIGSFKRPIKPNRCEVCPYAKICKNVVPRKEVEKILEKVRELKEILAR